MRLANSVFCLALSLLTLSSCAINTHFEEPKPTNSDSWTFVDTKSGASGFLSLKDERLVIAEEAFPVSFCPAASAFHCFTSEMAEFAVPKTREKQGHWVVGDRIYCIVRRFHDVSGPAEDRDGAWLIFSRKGTGCGGSKPFDLVAVFSKTAGLRHLTRHLEGGGLVELLSSDRIGFGVK